MLPAYRDIRALTDRQPDWFDGNGVPRYAPFEPEMLGVYDKYALLVLIQCQSCNDRFKVGEGWTEWCWPLQGDPIRNSLEDLASGYHYGDPPHHGGCVGETMNCVDLRILEAWHEPNVGKWERVPEVETTNIYPDWAK